MKSFVVIVFIVSLPVHVLLAQSTNGNSTTTGRENWFPNRGNVGVGTRTPSENLEVVGNIKATQTVFSQNVEAFLLRGGTLRISNDAFIGGNVGLGISTPSERLDVLGNVKVSGNIHADGLNIQWITSNSGVFNTLNVNQNAVFNGMVGIGISPTEKFHVGGNARIESDLYARRFTTTFIQTGELNTGLSSFSENASFLKNILVSGRIGIGLTTPSEALDVLGNIKSNAGLFSSTLSVSANALFGGSVGIGTGTPSEKLHVSGNLKVDDGIFSSGVITNTLEAGGVNVTGQSAFGDQSTFAKNVFINGMLGIGVSSPSEHLEINGNAKLSGGLTAASMAATTATITQKLFAPEIDATNVSVGNLFTVTGMSQLNGGFNAGGSSTVNHLNVTGALNAGNITINTLTTNGNADIGQNLNVAGTGQITGNLTVAGQLSGQAATFVSTTTSNSVNVGTNLIVNGSTQLKDGVTVTGNSTVGGNLQVTGTLNTGNIVINDLQTSGNATVDKNLTVSGTAQVANDLLVSGNIKAGVVEATEFRTPTGEALFNLDNVRVAKTLTVGTDKTVPANYKMAVGGNILATGIDIKIPEKWPDYVFTDGHKLLTLQEVEAFIKANGHLPNVLSAKEMEQKKNYSVSQMDATLLEKIEELTLYILQLEKRLQELEQKK